MTVMIRKTAEWQSRGTISTSAENVWLQLIVVAKSQMRKKHILIRIFGQVLNAHKCTTNKIDKTLRVGIAVR